VKHGWIALGLVGLAPLGPCACATCRPEAPPVEPSVTGRSSGGDADARVDLEVSNLFCKSPKPKPDAN
jgi:hypothetical protein